MYAKFFKRMFDFVIALCMLIILFPLLIFFTIIGSFKMKGSPFFWQERIGRDEKVFKLVKFRTMTNKRDLDGKLLPDEKRLTNYGHFLRSTSLDELPELFNILKGEMAIIGPRPLLVQYLPFYTEEEHHRHDVRPGLTGLAQINGRNFQSWEERFAYDLEYIRTISLKRDLGILIRTIKTVMIREGVGDLESGKIKKDENGKLWTLYNGQWCQIYSPLDEERRTGKG
ncbi:sugar transferase [Candidatus Merdisoma sp. JLR.KK006]|uniref:sugar transferase n=1 Tax=Candidatus Merdisoma sp. JLR.KK006 TaxID=3112626 RepID=UPI002FF38DB5